MPCCIIIRKSLFFISLLTVTILTSFRCLSNSNSERFEEECRRHQEYLQNANQLFGRGQYLLSATQYTWLFSSSCVPIGQSARYNYSLAMFQLGEFPEVDAQLTVLKNQHSALVPDLIHAQQFFTGDESNPRVWFWHHLKNKQGLQMAGLQTPHYQQLQELYLEKSQWKNPWIAASLSAVIPGLGQAYNGAYQSAIIALLLNALFFASTREFWDRHLEAPAMASALVFSVTYFGNILNAARASNRLNDANSAPVHNVLREELFPQLRPKE